MTRTAAARRVPIRGALALALVLAALLVPGLRVSSAPWPVHPPVAAWAAEHPGAQVPLVVQHDGDGDGLASFIRASGGTVERDFDIIPALDVTVSADELPVLARRGDVNWISLDAAVGSTGGPAGPVSKSNLATAYPVAIKAEDAWQKGFYGSGVAVALIDTGVSSAIKDEFLDATGASRLTQVSVRSDLDPNADGYGHGSHVAAIIGGYSTATSPKGRYTGIAPGADLVSVRIADDQGNATVGDLIAGLEWVDENRASYNIRVLNLSVASTVAQSYKVDPIDAAVELLWFHGVTVVVAAGNEGTASDAVSYPPANDPFVITVGAFDDAGSFAYGDDKLTSWSGRGTTQDGIAKPDLIGPGHAIVAPIDPASYLATTYASAIAERRNAAYFTMSGTSMAAATVSGGVALVLEKHPDWTPGEIKATLISKGRSIAGSAAPAPRIGDTNNQSKPAGNGDDGKSLNYLLLSALGVSSADFEGVRWRDVNTTGLRWRGLELNGIRWREIDWTGIRWRGVDFDSAQFGADFEGLRWRGIRWRAFVE